MTIVGLLVGSGFLCLLIVLHPMSDRRPVAFYLLRIVRRVQPSAAHLTKRVLIPHSTEKARLRGLFCLFGGEFRNKS
jgi:hypothetical protein